VPIEAASLFIRIDEHSVQWTREFLVERHSVILEGGSDPSPREYVSGRRRKEVAAIRSGGVVRYPP